jgi:hypothetical protein
VGCILYEAAPPNSGRTLACRARVPEWIGSMALTENEKARIREEERKAVWCQLYRQAQERGEVPPEPFLLADRLRRPLEFAASIIVGLVMALGAVFLFVALLRLI